MKQIKLFLLILLCSLGNTLLAQPNIEEIKNNPRYWSAEGIGTTTDEADNDALSQISKQIYVNISSRFREGEHTVGQGESVQSEFSQEGSVESSSFSSLMNIKMITLDIEPNARVFRYVEKSEVDSMFARRKNKVLDFIHTGKIAERRLQIDDALRNYYWALMLAKSYPGSIYTEFNNEKVGVLTALPSKIKSVIGNIKTSLKDCVYKDNRYYATLGFQYNDKDVSSVQVKYYDGASWVGPLVVKDGTGEMDLVSLPADEKIKFRFEYTFINEAKTLDDELKHVFEGAKLYTIDNAAVSLPVQVSEKKNTIAVDKKFKEGVSAETGNVAMVIPAEPVREVTKMELPAVENCGDYVEILKQVEKAIKEKNPESVFPLFTPKGYNMFDTLMNKTGKVTLVGRKQDYEFIRSGNQVIGRFCKLKVKFSNGKSFMENLVFRFDANSKKINSIAFALTKKAETDIFNAASSWTEVSRFAILQFMEDYQTAYALKRQDYLDQIFSDGAIIITGSVLQKAEKKDLDGTAINLGNNTDVKFKRHTKREYMDKLRQHFNDREYVHLTFEDNITKVINAPRLPRGTAFAIQINQLYNSPVYSDRGYLTLVLDASRELPIIHVRLWQPEKNEAISLDEFMNKFQF